MGGHTFICYARQDGDFVLRLATELKSCGISVWIDQWNIDAGQDWDETIDRSLREVATLLIDLSPAAVTSREVRGELRIALNLGKRIVPLIYRECEIPRQLQTVQYIRGSDSDTLSDSALNSLTRVLRQIAVVGPAAEDCPSLTRHELQIRRDLLDDMREEADGRLAQSLRVVPLIILKERQPDQVTRSWDGEVTISRLQPPLLPAATGILDVFDEEGTSGKLLILGPPGSGKTTSLLQLAQALVSRAQVD